MTEINLIPGTETHQRVNWLPKVGYFDSHGGAEWDT